MPHPQVAISPESSTEELALAVLELQRILTGRVGLGDAGEGDTLPRRTTPTPVRPEQVLARDDNTQTSLVDVRLDLSGAGDENVNLEITHGLDLPVPAARPGPQQKLNVRWIVAGIRYNAAVLGGLATDERVLVMYVDGRVDANHIDLRFYSNLPAAAGNELVVTLMFFPASS